MSSSVLFMSMSLDGYIAGPNDGPDNPGGDGFMRLHEWYGFPRDAAPGPEVQPPDRDGAGARFLASIPFPGTTPTNVQFWRRPVKKSLPKTE